MVGSIVVILVLFVITTAFVKIDTDGYQDIFFEFTLTTVADNLKRNQTND